MSVAREKERANKSNTINSGAGEVNENYEMINDRLAEALNRFEEDLLAGATVQQLQVVLSHLGLDI